MKKAILILSMLMLISFLQCQLKVSQEQAKQEALAAFDKWMNGLVDEDLDILTSFYPEGHTDISLGEGEFKSYDYNLNKKMFAAQFETIDYTGYEYKEEPIIKVSTDGKMAWYRLIMKIKYIVKNTGKMVELTSANLGILEKKNGKWLFMAGAEKFKPEERKTITVNPQILKKYSGTYKSEYSGNIYHISIKDNFLLIKGDNYEKEYFPQTECSFYTPEQKNAIVFVRNTQGKVTHYLSVLNGRSQIVKKIK